MAQHPPLVFEHPLNERIRTFLRAEYLFELARFRFNNPTNFWDAKDCVSTIIELYNLIERTEIRGELLKELERQINGLLRLGKTPAIDHHALEKVTQELEKSSDTLRSYSAKQGFFPKEADLLNALRQRLSIPGGTCSFDLPAFHYWLHLPGKSRQNNLHQWLSLLEPLEKSLALVLDLTRKSAMSVKEIATNGTYQKSLGTQTLCQLVRISMRSDLGMYPEISANKHRVNIRFLQLNFEQGKPALANQDVPFELACCLI